MALECWQLLVARKDTFMHELTDQEKDKFIDNLLRLEENGYKIVYRIPFRQKFTNILHLEDLPKLKPIAILGVAIVLIGLIVLGIKLQAIGRLDLLFRLLGLICILLLTAPLLGELLYIAFNACYNETNIHQEFLRYKLGEEKFRYLHYCNTELEDDLILLTFVGQSRQIINELKHDQKFQDYAHKKHLFDQMNEKELSENSQNKIKQTLKAFDKYMNHYQQDIEKRYIDPILNQTLMKIINDPKRKYYFILPKRIKAQIDNQLISNL